MRAHRQLWFETRMHAGVGSYTMFAGVPGYDMAGGDVQRVRPGGNLNQQPGRCAVFCNKNKNCVAFTLFLNTCYLKRNIGSMPKYTKATATSKWKWLYIKDGALPLTCVRPRQQRLWSCHQLNTAVLNAAEAAAGKVRPACLGGIPWPALQHGSQEVDTPLVHMHTRRHSGRTLDTCETAQGASQTPSPPRPRYIVATFHRGPLQPG